MSRPSRTYGEMREEIRRHIREMDASLSFWSDNLILNCMNLAKDYREMQLQQAHEGFGVEIKERDLVAGQAEYVLPVDEGVVRIKRVLIASTSGNIFTPLVRREKFLESTYTSPTGEPNSYRLVGGMIVLDPPPATSRTNGLRIEVEIASALFENDSDRLPDEYPVFLESLLILDTIILLFDHEGAQSPLPEGLQSSYLRQRVQYEELWEEYIETRSRGFTFSPRFMQGA